MDKLECHIHDYLKIESWKKLKVDAFYKNLSPVATDRRKYEIEYLHRSAYIKFYSAHYNIGRLKKWLYTPSPPGERIANILCLISTCLQDLFSICDLMAKQIFIAYYDHDLIYPLYLHTLKSKGVKLKSTNGWIWIIPKRQVEYNTIYTKFIKDQTDKDGSWYDDLRYYRNNNMHWISSFLHHDRINDKFYLMKKDMFEKNFEFIIKNEPVRNMNPTPEIENKFASMRRANTIDLQFEEYFRNVKDFAINIWGQMLELYLKSPAKSGVK